MNILILGGAGFFGANLVRRCLSDNKNRVTVVDSLDPRLKSSLENLQEVSASIEFIKGDIRDSTLMERVVKGQEVIFQLRGADLSPHFSQRPFVRY